MMDGVGEPVGNDHRTDATHGVTQILDAVRLDEPGARDRLIELVFAELHRLATRQLAHEAGSKSLQPTALVNEAWIRLFGASDRPAGTQDTTGGAAGPHAPQPRAAVPHFENRRHFFAAAAQAMHRICVDYARKRRSVKRGGAPSSQASPAGRGGGEPAVFDRDPLEVMAVDEALARLAERDPELVEIVRLRYFVDLSLDDTAKVLGISRRTVANRWSLAKAWLYEALRDFGETSDAE